MVGSVWKRILQNQMIFLEVSITERVGLESSKYEKEKIKKLIEGSLANFICEVNTRSSGSLLAKVRFLFLWAL